MGQRRQPGGRARVPRAGARRGAGGEEQRGEGGTGPAVRSSAGTVAWGGPTGSGGVGRDSGREKRGRGKRKRRLTVLKWLIFGGHGQVPPKIT